MPTRFSSHIGLKNRHGSASMHINKTITKRSLTYWIFPFLLLSPYRSEANHCRFLSSIHPANQWGVIIDVSTKKNKAAFKIKLTPPEGFYVENEWQLSRPLTELLVYTKKATINPDNEVHFQATSDKANEWLKITSPWSPARWGFEVITGVKNLALFSTVPNQMFFAYEDEHGRLTDYTDLVKSLPIINVQADFKNLRDGSISMMMEIIPQQSEGHIESLFLTIPCSAYGP